MLPPNEPEAAGHDELQGIGSGEDRPPMDELALRPWLQQGEPARGAELETLGLTLYAGHPELSLVNLPTAFIESGVRVLKELGTYVLAGGVLEDGDIMQMRQDLPYLVGIHAVPPAGDDDLPVMRVVMLA
ncbi:hypothetical protein [Miltoncostaea marina]|uniref:hypothetical protein n=1 Tax=Miltoncostaea marina TaxID=2843215 RepID=UPI001C3E4C28|nr:hypothetical protein [Miltoncostaea marina]